MNLITKLQEGWSDFTPVKADVTRRLYQDGKTAQLAALVLAVLFSFVMLKINQPPPKIFLWLVILATSYFGRGLLNAYYNRAPTADFHIIWLNGYRIATTITGLAWGAAAIILLFQPGDPINQSIILFTLTGLCAAATLTYAIDYMTLFGFLLPISFSMFFRLILENTHSSITMGLMVALFLIFIMVLSRKTNKDYVKNIALAKTASSGEAREKAYSRVMEMIATTTALETILNEIVHNLEKNNLEMLCSILICGAAAFTGSRVIAEDVLDHPNWVNYKELTIKANIRACWSEPIKDSTGKVLGTFAIYHRQPSAPTEKDIQIIMQNASLAGIAIELARNSQEQRLAALFYQNTNESMMILDSENTIVAVNPAFTTDTGYSAEEVVGKNPDFLKSGQHDAAFYSKLRRELIKSGKVKFGTDEKMAISMLNGFELTRFMTQANFDGLTGLPNRRMFHDRFEQDIKKTHRAGLPLALLFIDLDKFKEVNDGLGHPVGDILLKQTAERLISCVRELDTVARLGGDEFTITLGEIKDTKCIERIANNILEKLAEPYEETTYISASIGITLYPDDSTDIDMLLKNADQAMYAAKREGRNRFSYFKKAMQENVENQMRLTKGLRLALKKQQFHLVYQPIVDLKTNKIQKAEALIRWQHPKKGLISPADFIPVAEDSGLINDIGNWVFIEALEQALKWRQSIHPDFQHDLPGKCIAVEITEGLLLDTRDAVHHHLLAFRDAGIQVALDDFGTGYSSLSYLKKFAIDYIKIDQSFIQNLEQDSDDMALCEAIIVMAHKLKLKVIAEGIETQEQLDLLMSAGCDFGQGYFLSKPLKPNDLESLVS
ncbi:putative signaling protein [Nymphon striatum]|nr:putative signaling protein [Nymphon striatum]